MLVVNIISWQIKWLLYHLFSLLFMMTFSCFVFLQYNFIWDLGYQFLSHTSLKAFHFICLQIQTGIKIVRFINYNSRIRNVVTFSIRSARTTFKMLKLHQINRMKWLNQMIQTSVQKREMLKKHRNLEKPTVNIF